MERKSNFKKRVKRKEDRNDSEKESKSWLFSNAASGYSVYWILLRKK